MPVGRVKWFSLEKGFGFISSEEGEDVYLAASALPEGVATVKPGTKLEFGVAEGRKGPQALSVRIIDAPPSLANSKAGADDLAVIIEESIKMLDRVDHRNSVGHASPQSSVNLRRLVVCDVASPVVDSKTSDHLMRTPPSKERRRWESNPSTGLCRPLPKPLGHVAIATASSCESRTLSALPA